METGNQHPIRIVSLTNFTVVKEFSPNLPIMVAAFIGSSPLVLFRVPSTSSILIHNTETGSQITVPGLDASATSELYAGWANYYLCRQNTIRAFNIQAFDLNSTTSNSTNTTASEAVNTTNTTTISNSTNSTTLNTTTNSTPSSNTSTSNYQYLSIEMNDIEE